MDLIMGCGDRLRRDSTGWVGMCEEVPPLLMTLQGPAAAASSLAPYLTQPAQACVSVCLYMVGMGFRSHGSTRQHLIRKSSQVWGLLQKSRRRVGMVLGFSDFQIPGELRFCAVEGHIQSEPYRSPPGGGQKMGSRVQTLG